MENRVKNPRETKAMRERMERDQDLEAQRERLRRERPAQPPAAPTVE